MCETLSIFKYANFSVSALCCLASQLYERQACICDTSQVPACGSFNWAIRLSFVDGVEWVLRSPRDDGAIQSNKTNSLLLASEAATLRYIKANSAIPVPEVFAYRQARQSDLLSGTDNYSVIPEKTILVSLIFS